MTKQEPSQDLQTSFRVRMPIKYDDYICRDHRVHGVRLLPGVAYIDLIHRVLKAKGWHVSEISLEQIIFREPVSVSEQHDSLLEFNFEWQGQDHWSVSGYSWHIQGTRRLSEETHQNMNAEFKLIKQQDTLPEFDIAQFKAGANRVIDIADTYVEAAAMEIIHGPFMKGLGQVFYQGNTALAEIELGELAASYQDYFVFHPAFLDASTVMLTLFDIGGNDQATSIPFYIQSFRCLNSFGKKLYVYLSDDGKEVKGDTMFNHLYYFNEDGTYLGSMQRITVKVVREKQSIQRLTSDGGLPAVSVTPAVLPEVAQPVVQKQAGSTLQALRALVGKIAKRELSESEDQEGFYDLGLESSDLLEIVASLEAQLSTKLYPTLLFEYANIADLAEYLDEENYTLGGGEVAAPASPSPQQTQAPIQQVSTLTGLLQMMAEIFPKHEGDFVADEGFYDQGLESTDLLEFVAALEAKYEQKFYPTLLFEYSTPKDLSAYLEEEVGAWPVSATAQVQVGQVDLPSETLCFRTAFEPRDFIAKLPEIKSLVCFDREGSLTEALREACGPETTVIQVKSGRKFAEDGEWGYKINPKSEADYEALYVALVGRDIEVSNCIHAWTDLDWSTSPGPMARVLHHVFYAYVFWARAFLKQKSKQKLRWLLLFKGDAQKEQVHLDAFRGVLRTMTEESPRVIAASLQWRGATDWPETKPLLRLLTSMLPGIEYRLDDEQQLAVREFQEVTIPETDAPPLRKEGVYVITGGAAGLGYMTARWLARDYAAKLVLCGRSAPGERSETAIAALKELGGDAVYVTGDAGSKADLRKVVREGRKAFGAINGVFHAAGVLRDAYVMEKTAEEIDTVLPPKIRATEYLDELTLEDDLDCFVMFSSLSASAGNAGQVDYAYGNGFMDAFARNRQALVDAGDRKGRSLSINWPLWDGGGMQVDEPTARGLASLGLDLMQEDYGMDAMFRLLQSKEANVTVVRGKADAIRGMFLPHLQKKAGPKIVPQAPVVPSETPAASFTPPKTVKPSKPTYPKAGQTQQINNEPIAVIGVAGRYPQSADLVKFWENLTQGVDCVTEIPPERWEASYLFDEDKNKDLIYGKYGGFIDDVDCFDARFFNLPPRWMRDIDPQERIFLESAWHAFEDAGYPSETLNGKSIGVFAGVMWSHYQLFGLEETLKGRPSSPTSLFSAIANRVSYVLNLRGPSMAVDTMCSSSLTAMHLAIDSIRTGQSEMALAGGVNLTLHPQKYLFLSQNRMISAEGKCKAFGKDGEGYVPGEGVGVVVLKPLSKAIEDGDFIYATIIGNRLNHGGKTSGFTVPSPVAQGDLIEETLKLSGVPLDSISYLETHGTGTSLGDPIEITGLNRAFKKAKLSPKSVPVGSVKPNVGHLESAAGIASVTKLLLQFKYRKLTPSIHSEPLNPNIDWETTPFYVNHEYKTWQPKSGYPLRAGVSAFGAGGSNAHLIFEAAEDDDAGKLELPLFVLSARDDDRLTAYAQRIIDWLDDGQTHGTLPALHRLCFSSQIGRSHLPERLVVHATSHKALRQSLQNFVDSQMDDNVWNGSVEKEAPQADMSAWIKQERWSDIANYWIRGGAIHFARLYSFQPRKVPFPGYPFKRESIWIERAPGTIGAGQRSLHPLIDQNVSSLEEQAFEKQFRSMDWPVQEHLVNDKPMLPGTFYAEMAKIAAQLSSRPMKRVAEIRDLQWLRPFTVEGEDTSSIRTVLIPQGRDLFFEVISGSDEREALHAQGQLVFADAETEQQTIDLFAIKDRCVSQNIAGPDHYQTFVGHGFTYGNRFQTVQEVMLGEGEALAVLRLSDDDAKAVSDALLLDGAMQVGAHLLDEDSPQMIPSGIQKVCYTASEDLPETVYAHVMRLDNQGDSAVFAITLCDDQGQVLLSASHFELSPMAMAKPKALEAKAEVEAPTEQAVEASQVSDDALLQGINHYLKDMIAQESGLDISEIQDDVALENIGIDSVMIMAFNNTLEAHFEDLSKTLFFEYQTVEELSGYFLKNHAEAFQKVLGLNQGSSGAKPVQKPVVAVKPAKKPKAKRRQRFTGGGGIARRDIAIVGLAGKYPKARDLEAFWYNLKEGVDCIEDIPKSRFNSKLYFDPEVGKPGRLYSERGGFIENPDYFDPLFFGIPPKGAVIFDPQERLFLETAWQTLEDAGYTRKAISGSNFGVFVGVMWSEYQLLGIEEEIAGEAVNTSSMFASIANRVSYFLNLHGPSMAIDTMCSSSITALQMACNAIQQGQCDAAFAGGVNLSLHPHKFLHLAEGRFAAADGKCKAFGADGSGYVPGEGVGAVLLKPLEQAEKDGDNIYAVIRGSALNHGGKTNGYTVPSPVAQGNLIRKVLQDANLEMADLDYIECHGTGTSLGDPIEINGLLRAYEESRPVEDKIPIGSVKSNIGHLESAAGISQLTKVLLQMKYGQLVPSLHSQPPNPNINFKKSPFRVVNKLQAWQAKGERPVRAAISSYGAGGSNGHVILEKYERDVPQPDDGTPRLVLFSAESDAQVKQYAQKFLDFLNKGDLPTLAQIAFTTQVGREPLRWRLAIQATSLDQLRNSLQSFVEKGKGGGMWFADSDGSKASTGDLVSGDFGKRVIDLAMAEGNMDRVAKIWVNGSDLDWLSLYDEDALPGRVTLPTYPFNYASYYFKPAQGYELGARLSALHPLVDRNLSDLEVIRYQKDVSEGHWFTDDHRIGGRALLPGVMFIEMVKAAASLLVKEGRAISAQDIVWHRPFVAQQKRSLFVDFQPEADGLAFQVASGDAQQVLHTDGLLQIGEPGESHRLDLADFKAQCSARRMDRQQHYAYFQSLGFNYGLAFRIVEEVLLGEKRAYVRLKPMDETPDYARSALFLEGALQASVSLLDEESGPCLPYAIDQIHWLFDAPDGEGVALIQRLPSPANEPRFSIQICDADGTVFCDVESFRLKEAQLPAAPMVDARLFFTPTWSEQEQPIGEGMEGRVWFFGQQAPPAIGADVVHFQPPSGSYYGDATWLQALVDEQVDQYGLPAVIVYHAHAWQAADQAAVNASFFQWFHLLQALMRKPGTKPMRLLHVGVADGLPFNGGIASFMRTVNAEQPKWFGSVALMDTTSDLSQVLLTELNQREEVLALYQGTERQVERWQVAQQDEIGDLNEGAAMFEHGDVALVTGGLGGLGLAFARSLGAAGVHLLLCGRGELKGDRIEKLEALRELGVKADYLQLDVSDQAALNAKIPEILETYGKLDGVIHSAGVQRDAFIIKKDAKEAQSVIVPKVLGTHYLDEATKDLPLKAFVLFSSVSGALGNAGQCDYAFANAFIDHFATRRNQQAAAGTRQGKSFAINWPLWLSGMGDNPGLVQQIEQGLGWKAMTDPQGVAAFETIANLTPGRVIVMQGKTERLLDMMSDFTLDEPQDRAADVQPVERKPAPRPIEKAAPAAVAAATAGGDTDLRKHMVAYLREMVAKESGLSASSISETKVLEDYGIDSVMITSFNGQLDAEFEQLSKTLFFEYQTVGELADYFMAEHHDELVQKFGSSEKQTAETPQQVVKPAAAKKARTLALSSRFQRGKATASLDDVAIVGVAGRYPNSRDLASFWRNIVYGNDCIVEVPPERWDIHRYFEERSKDVGTYGRWGGFIDGLEKFDPLFFKISPGEADFIDPQERLFLQTSWEAMEDSGYNRETMGQLQTGVFVGVMWNEHNYFGMQESMRKESPSGRSSTSSIANRVSYALNLTGPSVGLDTMCSSSLTSLHLACRAIQNGDCDMALAGGVNVSIHPSKYLTLTHGGFLASDGRCRSFGVGGDGYVPAEGVGALILKPLAKAVADGDFIYGVVKSSGLNHGGKTNGYTVPNPKAQGALIRQVLEKGQVDANSISYLETHGTGTPLGDPIEISGLTQAFKPDQVPNQSVRIGSLKSVMGHMEAAAGVGAITKVLLQFKHRMLPPSLHSETLNPNIDFASTPFVVQQAAEAWQPPRPDAPLRAGISSFGAGGSNAHVILEEPPPRQVDPEQNKQRLVLLSARSEERLVAYAQKFIDYLVPLLHPEPELPQVPALEPEFVAAELSHSVAFILKTSPEDIDASASLPELGLDPIGTQHLAEAAQKLLAQPLTVADLQQCNDLHDLKLQLVKLSTPKQRIRGQQELPPMLRDLAFTTQVGREPLSERLAIVTESLEDLLAQLQQFVEKPGQQGLIRGNAAKSQLAELIEDEESNYLMESALRRDDLARLGRFWANGMAPNWELLYQDERTYRVPLPTYPFEEQTFRFPDAEASLVPAIGRVEEIVEPRPQLFVPVWQDQPVSAQMHYLKGDVLLLVNETSEALVNPLRQHCKETNITVINTNDFQADDHQAGSQLFSSLEADGFAFKTLIDFSDIHVTPQAVGAPPLGKMRLIQRWLDAATTRDLTLRHFTCGLEGKGAQASLAGASTAGLVELLAAELRYKLNACSIDVDRFEPQSLMQTLLSEWHVEEPSGRLKIYNGRRAVPSFRSDVLKPDGSHLQQTDGVVVITGGTGGIGAEMALHLTSKGFNKFVLMGVRPLPERSKWQSILAESKEASTIAKIQKITALEATGAQVKLYFGALSDKPALDTYFKDVRQNFGRILGLIHCAGLVATPPGPFVGKDLEMAQGTFEPKIEAVHTLRDVFRSDALNFFYLFSSMSGVLPRLGAGMADYAVANFYMDRFAHYCQQQGDTVVQSIQWPNWKEVGMGERPSPVLEAYGIQGMLNAEAMQLFDGLGVPSTAAQILPAVTLPGSVAFSQWRAAERLQSSQPKQAEAAKAMVAKASQATNLEGFVLAYLLDLFAEELRMGHDELDPATNFDEYGIDSIFLADIVRKIEPWLGAAVDPSAILENPTLNGVVEYLLEDYRELVEAKFAETGEVVEAAPVAMESAPAANPVAAKPAPKPQAPVQASVTASAGKLRMGDGEYEKIAIIGMSGHFPGASDLDQYWDNLKNGVFSVKVAPKSRWDVDQHYASEPQPGKSISKWGGYLESIADFDPEYFRVRPEEAPTFDPLIRQFLEVSAECFNHGGYTRKELANSRTGVYCGTRVANWSANLPPNMPVSVAGTGQNFIGAHISHFYNLKGPNITLDTACSSSLTAIHLACQSLMLGESDMALAGGVDVILNEMTYISLSSALSPDGKCHTFDEKANGFVPGEGAGAVLLKPLSKAVADGDTVYGVIEASAINNDGATMGITTPNPEMQRAVIQDAMRVGGIHPSSVGYLEAHGTGTLIGDPIELKALTKVFRTQTDENQFCAVGSVKSNFGHLLSAAGMASTVKVVLSILNKQIPPTLHCDNPNPRFKFETSPFYPNTELRHWEARHGTRRAGISGFGFGGTNAHIIIGEATPWLPAGYQPQRKPLPAIRFNRRRFWPWEDGEVVEVEEQVKTFAPKPPQQTMDPAALMGLSEEQSENLPSELMSLVEDRASDLMDLQEETDTAPGALMDLQEEDGDMLMGLVEESSEESSGLMDLEEEDALMALKEE